MLALALTASLVAPPVELGWRAPAGCPDEAAARAAIDEMLQGRTPPDDRRIVADVAIDAGGEGFRARVRIDDGQAVGERELEATSCEAVGEAAALIVAMAIDPRLDGAPSSDPPPPGDPSPPDPLPDPLVAEPPVPAPPPASSSGPVASAGEADDAAITPVASASAEREPEPERARLLRPPRLLVRAGAGVGLGSVSSVAGTVMLAVALGGPRWRVELDADVWTPRMRPTSQGDAIGVRVLGFSLGVRGCGSPLAARLEIPLCAGMRAGALHGRGEGPFDSRAALSPWVVASAGVGLWGWIVPRFALALDIDGFASITRPAFDLQPSGFTVRAPAGGVRAVFGPVVKFP